VPILDHEQKRTAPGYEIVELADGWLAIYFSPKVDGFYRDALAEGFARPGARCTAENFNVSATVPVIFHDDVETVFRAGITAGCVLVFIPSLGAYLAPDLLGGGRTAYIGNLIQSQFAVARDMPFGAALSFVLSLLVVLLLVAFRRPLRSAQAL